VRPKNWLLMLDEVQCGMGRTGKWFAHQWAGIKPDVMPLAKGLGSGVPIGAVAVNAKANVLGPGNHGTTFGGNPLAMRAGVETLRIMEEDGLMAHAAAVAQLLNDGLRAGLADEVANGGVVEFRGQGLMIGIELDRPCGVLLQPRGRSRAADQRHRRPRGAAAAAADPVGRRGAADCRHPVSADQGLPRRAEVKRDVKPGDTLMKHYLQFKDLRAEEYAYLFERARLIKTRFKNYEKYQPLADRTLAMIFEKASTRTRVSFEAGMYQMGGSVVHLTTGDSQLGRAEPIEDSARVISRMCDLVMIRTYEQAKLVALRGALARAGDQRADQRIPPVPDPGRHPDLHRAPRLDSGQGGGLGRRRQQHGQHLAAGGRDPGLHGARQHTRRLRIDPAVAGISNPDCYKVFKDPMDACAAPIW
jgi:ornithine carbamoyltransferase